MRRFALLLMSSYVLVLIAYAQMTDPEAELGVRTPLPWKMTTLQDSLAKVVSIIRKNHNHKLRTKQWYREEESHNNHETPRRQTKQDNQLSSPSRLRLAQLQPSTRYQPTDLSFTSEPSLGLRPDPPSCN